MTKPTSSARQPSATGDHDMTFQTFIQSYRITYKHPIPSSTISNLQTRYPFKYMSVGHSFIVPRSKEAAVRSAAHSYGKLHNMQFTCRVQPDGIRIWRIA